MWKRDELLSRAVSVLLGVTLFFILPITVGNRLGDDTPLLLPIIIAAYTVCGVVLGFVWHDDGWRLGIYLFAIWPPALLFAIFLAGELPWTFSSVWRDLKNLLGYLLILVAAGLGSGLGSFIRRRLLTGSES
jgi:hypothetical protein